MKARGRHAEGDEELSKLRRGAEMIRNYSETEHGLWKRTCFGPETRIRSGLAAR